MQTLTRSNSVLSSGSGLGIGQIEETQIHPQLDYQLDLSKYTQSMLQVFLIFKKLNFKLIFLVIKS